MQVRAKEERAERLRREKESSAEKVENTKTNTKIKTKMKTNTKRQRQREAAHGERELHRKGKKCNFKAKS